MPRMGRIKRDMADLDQYRRVLGSSPAIEQAIDVLTVRALVSRLEEEASCESQDSNAEFSLRDPYGYFVTISALNAA
jgi:hypothetical protein